MDWLDFLAVQGTLKSLLQHHSSKASILQHSAFFIVQLSHPYMTTGKAIALTRRTFVGKVMSLLFNMLSRLVIAFLPRSKCFLISWLQSPSAVILEPKKINVCCWSPQAWTLLRRVHESRTMLMSIGSWHRLCWYFGTFCSCCSVAKLCMTRYDPVGCSTPGSSVLHCLPEFAQSISCKSVMLSNHLIPCCPLLLPSVFPSIRIFSSESALHIRWPEYWSFSFSISPSNVYSGLLSFRMDWLDLLAVQGTLGSLLQHHSSKASINHT